MQDFTKVAESVQKSVGDSNSPAEVTLNENISFKNKDNFWNLPAITIAQKVIITVISKEELVALLLTKWQLKVSCSSDRLIVLTMRFRYYDHNIAIFDCGEGIKIVASKYMFKLIDPLLERRSIESEIKK